MPDEEMINRVSRAILTTPNASDYETLVAKRAIEAMRELPESYWTGHGKYANDIWRSVIDRILKTNGNL